MSLKLILSLALLAWNTWVFILYGIDKYRAIKHKWRIPEKMLLLVSFILGGFGAFLASRIFHHKTKKLYFRLTWLFGMMLDIIIIYYLRRI